MGKIILCADSESIAMPELLGLIDINLMSFEWLECYSDAQAVRARCNKGDIMEIWLIGADDISSLNLSAALRHDDDSLVVTIVESNPTGSFMSRASQAKVTRVITSDEFCALFHTEVRRRSLMSEVASLEIDAVVADRADVSGVRDAQREFATERECDAQLECDVRCEHDAPHVCEAQGCVISDTPRGDAFVISIFGGSGGVGRSSFCAMAGYACASRGLKTAVVDLDLQFGDLSTLCSEAPIIPISNVKDDSTQLAVLVEDAGSHPVIIECPASIEDSEIIAPHIPAILGYCSNVFDVVIVNTQSHWNDASVTILERSNCSVFVMDQRASSVRACMRITELCLRMGVATGSFVYALNGCSKGAMFNPLDVSNAMQGAQVFELCDGSAEVEEMLGAGGAFELFESGNEFVKSVQRMVYEIVPKRDGDAAANNRNQHQRSKGKVSKGQLLERRSGKGKKRRDKKPLDEGAESLMSALFGSSKNVDDYIADEMKAIK